MKMDPFIILIVSSLISIINYLFWARIKRIEKDTFGYSQDIEKIKTNYLSRFDEIKTALNQAEKNIIERLHEFEKNIIQNYVSKKECDYFHD